MIKLYLIVLLCLSSIFSQVNQPYPPVNLVSLPTAGTLPRGYFAFENIFTKDGGILPKFSLGITDNLMIGMSYGIQNFIGVGELIKNRDYPEIQLKYRVYEESATMPAMVIGIDTQGKGKYLETIPLNIDPDEGDLAITKDVNRYEQKALGVYFVVSRNWEALGNFGFHVGLNKSINEDSDGDDDINLFFGFDKELNRSFSIFGEYNFARDDDGIENSSDIDRKGNGYLNAGLRWSATPDLMLEINFNDLAKNNENYNGVNRELKIIYFEQF